MMLAVSSTVGTVDEHALNTVRKKADRIYFIEYR